MTLAVFAAAAPASDASPAWLAALAPLAFVATWIAVTTLVGWLSGHTALLARFPPQEESLEESSFA